jgi:hypothetical protein
MSLFSIEHHVVARSLIRTTAAVALLASMSGCSVLAVADAAVTVAATAVSVTATVVETTVDVAAAGVRAVTAEDKDPKAGEGDKADDKQGAEQRREPAPEAPATPAAPQRTWQPPDWPASR